MISLLVGPLAILIIVLAWWFPQIASSNLAARVNGEEISKDSLRQEVALSRVLERWRTGQEVVFATQTDEERYTARVLDGLIRDTLVTQLARKAGFSVSTSEAAAEVARLAKEFKLSDQEMDTTLIAAGLSRSTLVRAVQRSLLIDRFLEATVYKGLKPEERDIAYRNWYNGEVTKASIDRYVGAIGPRLNQPAPDFVLQDLTGTPVRLSDLKGQAVMINFFATWCSPCRQEMPDLQAAYAANKDKGFVLLAVNLTAQDDVKAIPAYVKQLGLTFPILLDTKNDVTTLYRIGPLPTSFFIDRGGIVRAIHQGVVSPQLLNTYIAKIL
jgi:peroxiredoxin